MLFGCGIGDQLGHMSDHVVVDRGGEKQRCGAVLLMCCSSCLVDLQGSRLVGMGSGQPNRVKSVEIALEKAGEESKGAAMASDAFFPFG